MRLAAAIHAANLAVRAAGAAGLGVLLVSRRDAGIGASEQSAAYVLGRQVAHIAFACLVVAALVLLGADGHLPVLVAGGAALFIVTRIVHIAVLWFAATHPQALPHWKRLDPVRAHAPAFAAALRCAVAHPLRLLPIAAWAVALDALRVGWLWVSLRAVGAHLPLDGTLEAYGVVALLAMFSVLPAGLGAVDAGLVATLEHAGVTMPAAVAGVMLYRVAELWVPLAAGARPALAAARRRSASA